MFNRDNAEQLAQLCEQMIQQAPRRDLLRTYRSVMAILRGAFVIQADSLDKTERICNGKQEIIHGLEIFCVRNGLSLPQRSDDDQPAIERPPTKH